MAEVLKKFGRYFLLDHIAQGGMAEIYRARLAAADGAGRLIVIKKVIAGYGANKEFLQMFRSEIKVTMGFTHPNIVQLFDFGEEKDQPYIAMELVEGRNLRQFISKYQELKKPFPIELAVYIIEQAAGGLQYAHSFKDKISGEPLNIVHRDISPQNILISYEGNVKVIDFGIAKATTNMESTRAGVIKGKPSYLSPEQISGAPLDGRSDLFALGAVLWEMLAGKKLFAGDNDLAVLKLIESCQTSVKPPSTVNPLVPKDLDYIVLQLLAKSREKRFQNAADLQRALHKFLYNYSQEFNPQDLSQTAKDLFKNEIVEDRKRIQRLAEKAETILATQRNEESSPKASSPASPPTSPPERELPSIPKEQGTIAAARLKKSGARELESGDVKGAASREIKLDVEPYQPQRTSMEITRKKPPSSGTTFTRHSTTSQSPTMATGSKTLSDDEPQKSSGSGFLKAAVILLLLGGGAFIAAPQFGIQLPGLSKDSGKPSAESRARPEAVTQVKEAAPSRVTSSVQGKSVLMHIRVSPAGGASIVSLGGTVLDPSHPSSVVPLDSPLELQVDRPGYKPFRSDFVLDSKQVGSLKEYTKEIQLEPFKFGYLTIHTTPSAEVSMTVDGSPWRKKTPIENEKLPVGTYQMRLFNEVLGMEKSITVTLPEGKSITVDERLNLKN